ncbi:MAG TPA: S24 family peptidase [Nevskia sp.]|nr:S24 family peptidase [Nevskia sp.]
MLLTPRQQQVVDFLRDYAAREGMPPTQAEIASRFGFTQKAAGDHLKLIAAKGVIELRRDIPRGIRFPGRVAEKTGGPAVLPLLLRLEAGAPSLRPDQVDDWVAMAPALFQPPADYLRRARGASMVELGIRDGDLIGVQLMRKAPENQVVVAKLLRAEGMALVVRPCLRRGNALLLRQAAAAEPDLAEMEIEGLYCGHFHAHGGEAAQAGAPGPN